MKRIVVTALFLAGVARVAAGQEPPGPDVPRMGAPEPPQPPPPPVAAVPEASFHAVVNQNVAVTLADGRAVHGRLLAVENGQFTLAMSAGRIATFPVAQVVELRLLAPPRPSPTEAEAQPSAPATPPSAYDDGGTHVGIFTGFLLLNSGVDIESGGFYGFASTSLLLPVIVNSIDNGHTFADGFTIGAGGSSRVARDSLWHFDYFGVLTTFFVGESSCSGCSTDFAAGVGLGVGVHATFESGLTLSLKIPVLGFAFGNNGFNNGIGVTLYGYYLIALATQPLFSFGYRW